MKRKKLITVLLILSVIVITAVSSFRLHAHTFSDFLIEENLITNFYPEGPANQYKAVNVISPGEDQRVWKFRLNRKEVNQVNDELKGDIWQLISVDGCKYIDEAYFAGYLFEYDESDEIYYCLYDLKNEWYKNIGTGNTLLYGEENLLFVYNKTTAEFYCAVKIV